MQHHWETNTDQPATDHKCEVCLHVGRQTHRRQPDMRSRKDRVAWRPVDCCVESVWCSDEPTPPLCPGTTSPYLHTQFTDCGTVCHPHSGTDTYVTWTVQNLTKDTFVCHERGNSVTSVVYCAVHKCVFRHRRNMNGRIQVKLRVDKGSSTTTELDTDKCFVAYIMHVIIYQNTLYHNTFYR